MAAVVLGHIVSVDNVADWAWFTWHIPGFLLISGYFGIRFSWGKVAKLLVTVYVLYWLTTPLRGFNETTMSLLMPHGGWFLPFYLVLMLISPLLEAALEQPDRHLKTIIVSTAIVLVVAWIPCFSSSPHVGMMRVAGMQGNGLLLMIATYVLGRSVFVFKDSRYMRILRGGV